jgi:hypothetical protein
MTRAVIQLSNDISNNMPRLSGLIEGCAYNPEAKLMAFRFKNMTVRVESRQINIDHIEDEKMVQTFMDWFVALANSSNNKRQ